MQSCQRVSNKAYSTKAMYNFAREFTMNIYYAPKAVAHNLSFFPIYLAVFH